MNIIHRISFSKDENLFYRFEKNNIKIKKGLINYFDIGENDKNWSFVKSLIRKYSTVIFDNQYKTEFSKKEFDQAACFILTPEWHFEYSQPEEDFGYQHLTYDDSFACYSCGVGIVKTEEYFGSGKSAFQRIIINRDMYEFFITNNIKGIGFIPMKIY